MGLFPSVTCSEMSFPARSTTTEIVWPGFFDTICSTNCSRFVTTMPSISRTTSSIITPDCCAGELAAGGEVTSTLPVSLYRPEVA